MLWRDPSVDGMKTGMTDAAGYCLVSSAQRDGMRLVSVLLGTASAKARADATQALLNWGFSFTRATGFMPPESRSPPRDCGWARRMQIPLGLREDLWVTVPRGRYDLMQPPWSCRRPDGPRCDR
jgi:serine-type D-Ala-D-Ala carboxypeptidase (penicillin-binding protein 5/6)